MPRYPTGPDLALAQRDGIQFLGELHEVSKFVEVGGGISARGEDEDEGSRGGRIREDQGQV